MAECHPSLMAMSAAWRASCSAESEIEYIRSPAARASCGSFRTSVGWRGQSLFASAVAPSRVRPATTSTAPSFCAFRHVSSSGRAVVGRA